MENRRIPINVSVNPSEYSGRSVRLGGNSDIREKMNQRMQEFEEESRKWRDQFLSSSGLSQPSLIDHNRPRMVFNFPEFPEIGSGSGFSTPLSRLSANPSSALFPPPFAQNTHKSFMEEDDHGSKKYKMTFEVGDFKPTEIQVRTEGRQLIVKGDRELVAGTATESKQFNREITLPDFVEPTSVTSFLSDGVLTIEAPVLLDSIGYNPSHSLTNTITSSASTLRNSPFRDNASPSRASFSTSASRNFASNRDDTTLSSTTPSTHSTFTNSPLVAEPKVNSPAIYKFNMSEFRPEDIAITVTDTTLKIHALREENDMRGSGKSYREFKREIGLPQGADVQRLRNALQPDGTLTIEIPVNDNSTHRPPLSPTEVNKAFGNFSFNDANTNLTSSTLNSNNSNSELISNTKNSLLSNSNSNNNNNDNGVIVDHSNNGKELKLTFDLTGYKPEDLSIKVIDNNTLKVHAVHIDNTKGNQIHREYTR